MNDQPPQTTGPVVTGREFLAGGGALGERVRALARDRTPLGRPGTWAQSLRTAVRIMLTSRPPGSCCANWPRKPPTCAGPGILNDA